MKPSTEQDYQERVIRTLVYIQEHLNEDLPLEEVASVAAFSRFHFHRIFRAFVGEGLKQYVRRLRLERAARNLRVADEPVTQIAFEAGFETHESFTRAFSDMFGCSPSVYRSTRKFAPEPESTGAAGTDLRPPECGDLPVEIKELPARRLVFLRHVGPYNEVGATWARLMMWAGMRGLLGAGTEMLGMSHDDPDVTPSGKIRYDAAVVVNRPVQPEGDFGVMDLPGGKYAVVNHKGPYENLSGTYRRIYGGWLPTSGYELRDTPGFEQYLNSPQNTRPEDLITLIHVPLVG